MGGFPLNVVQMIHADRENMETENIIDYHCLCLHTKCSS